MYFKLVNSFLVSSWRQLILPANGKRVTFLSVRSGEIFWINLSESLALRSGWTIGNHVGTLQMKLEPDHVGTLSSVREQ